MHDLGPRQAGKRGEGNEIRRSSNASVLRFAEPSSKDGVLDFHVNPETLSDSSSFSNAAIRIGPPKSKRLVARRQRILPDATAP